MGLYDRSAAAYDLIERSLGKSYESESEYLAALIRRLHPSAASLLDVGCGSGRHLALLRQHFPTVAGVELSEGMVDEARRRYPDIEVTRADMRDFDLGATFDVAVCLSGSIGYMTTGEDLVAALTAMARHVGPGGLVVVEGWYTPDEWHAGRLATHVTSEPGLGVGRLVASSASRGGTLGHLDMAYLILAGGRVEHVDETHDMGLFTEAEYEDAFRRAGLAMHEEEAQAGRGMRLRVGRRG